MVKRLNLIHYIFIILLGCFCFANIAFASDVSFSASVQKNRISLNEKIQLSLTVTGSQDVGYPELPQLNDFEITSSGTSSQFSVINGQMSASKSFNYLLTPLKEGSLTIPPATIEIDGEVLESNPITVEVTKGASPWQQPSAAKQPAPIAEKQQTGVAVSDRLSDRIFIKVSTDKDTAYLGEQITMTFELYYSNVMIDHLQYSPPATKGFITESMGQQKESRKMLDGIPYKVIELKTAIFPATLGELTIEPANLKCNLLIREQRSRQRRSALQDDFFDSFFEDSFFGGYKKYPIELESETLNLTIKPLPLENKPDTFKGAVGIYRMNITASPKELKAGEPINLKISVLGSGNITQLQEPVIRNMKGFKSYESEVKTDITHTDPYIAGQKTFQKIIIPQNENIKEIPLIEFSYFDPKDNEYHTITDGPIAVTVLPAPKKATKIVELMQGLTPDDQTQKAVKLLAKDIHYIKRSPGKFTKKDYYWYKNIWIWAVVVLLPLFLIVIIYIYKTHHKRMQSDMVYARSKMAHKISKKWLDEAIKNKKSDKPKEFFDSIARAIQKFICDRLNIPAGVISVNRLEELLMGRRIKPDLIQSLKNLLDTCDQVRFGAHTIEKNEMKNVLKEANRILGALSKKI